LLNKCTAVHRSIVEFFISRRADDNGASLVEYALLLALIVAVAILAMTFLGNTTSNLLNNSGQFIANQ
jgi:Flp pilus assembly pilin Flp